MWFEKEIKSDSSEVEKENAIELWNKTKEYFSKLKHWFENDYLYHHIGFLLALKDNSISNVRHIIDMSNCEKSKFKDWALNEVIAEVSDINLNNISYEINKGDLKKVFLLHNILTSNLMKSAQKNRFPFNLYKKIENDGGWSIEHIHAQQSKEMKDEKAIKKWLEETYLAIEDINSIDKALEIIDDVEDIRKTSDLATLKNKVQQMLNSDKINVDDFNLLKSELIQLFDSDSIHILDNLALLSKKDNSFLNNAIFPVKRNRIIQMEKEGKYIPIATKNIFLKYYSNTDLQPYYWGNEDKQSYFQDINSKLKPYLTK